jgi:hypothetical protein
MERNFPPPSFPTSLNVFYKSSPKTFKERDPEACGTEDARNFIARQVVLKRRFPRLEVSSNICSVSPAKKTGYLHVTGQAKQRMRSVSPVYRSKAFVPCNASQAKEISSRKASIFKDNPYDAPKEIAFIEYKADVSKRINGDFKRAMNDQFLHDTKSYLNSLNTFEMFSSVSSEGRTRNSLSLFKN